MLQLAAPQCTAKQKQFRNEYFELFIYCLEENWMNFTHLSFH